MEFKDYIPVTSVRCIIGAKNIHDKRVAELESAYEITRNSFEEYKKRNNTLRYKILRFFDYIKCWFISKFK